MNQPTCTLARRGAVARVAAAASVVTLPVLGLLVHPARAHSDKPHVPKEGAVSKEQKDWGIAGDARNAKRRIEVGMTDNMRFTPARIEVRQGETVKFVVRNTGKVMHEFVIGTKAEFACRQHSSAQPIFVQQKETS